MNKTLVIILMLVMAVPATAQDRQQRKGCHREIAEMVGDLSQGQKKKLDAITDASRKRVEALRAQQKAVRDSITRYMNMEGDQSRVLFPLFDREAQLSRDISREMYTTKVRIDEVLTPQQRQQVREACRRPSAKSKKSPRK